MDQFTRNADGTVEVPLGVVDVAACFALGSTQYSVAKFVELVGGEATAIELGNYAEELAKLTHPQLLGCLCEGWASLTPLAPIVELLLKLDKVFTLRALLAQRLCSDYREGFVYFSFNLPVNKLLTFYATTSGLGDEAIRLHGLRHDDTAPIDLADK